MKMMTCKQLGGACGKEFRADTFDEMAELSKKHGSDMFQQKDDAHMQAMQKVMGMMKDPDAMKAWMDGKRQEFDALPEDA